MTPDDLLNSTTLYPTSLVCWRPLLFFLTCVERKLIPSNRYFVEMLRYSAIACVIKYSLSCRFPNTGSVIFREKVFRNAVFSRLFIVAGLNILSRLKIKESRAEISSIRNGLWDTNGATTTRLPTGGRTSEIAMSGVVAP